MRRGHSLVLALAVAGALALLASFVTAYAMRAVFDSDQFAKRAAASLENQAVSDEVAARVADGLVSAEPNLVAVRPVLESVTSSIVRGGAFQSVFRAGVSDLHRGVFDRDESSFSLTLLDIGTTVQAGLQAFDPKLAQRVPAGGDADLVKGKAPDAFAGAVQLAESASWVPAALLVIAIVCAGLSLKLAADRRVAMFVFGVTMLLAGVVFKVAMRVAEVGVLSSFDDETARDAAAGIWGAFLGDLGTGVLLFAVCGAVIAAAASSLLRPVDLASRLERLRELATTVPERRGLRALRGIALAASGALIVVSSDAFVSLLATLFGLFVAYAGVSELMRMSLAPRAPDGDVDRGRGILVGVVSVALAILGSAALFVGVGGVTQPSPAIATTGCNGSKALCDRPFDRVAFPATHNSMSAASYPNWLFAQQERGIADQLRDGVRGLLIDAHFGVETQDGTIKTDLSTLDRGERRTYEDALGKDALDAALRVRDRIVNSAEVSEPGVYLCHRFCELGAITIDQGFSEIHDFMDANPEEVVVVVVEDYVPADEIAAAAERTALIDDVYMGPVGTPWPTLREIGDSGGRVVMMAENDAGRSAVPWYHPAYASLVQETPFSFSRPAQLTEPDLRTKSCVPNRGPAEAGLFLVNHWIDTSPAPRPSNAAIVNAREALLRRVRRCEPQRDLLANLIAIDFYREGDVFGMVSELNDGR